MENSEKINGSGAGLSSGSTGPNNPTPPTFGVQPPAPPSGGRKWGKIKWLFVALAVLVVGFLILNVVGGPSATPPSTDTSVPADQEQNPPASAVVPTPAPNASAHTEFGSPELVTIKGYDGPAEDPTISPDGTIMFFDSHTDSPKIPIKQYWAKKIDYKTFAFQGEIQGFNRSGVEAFAATMDSHNNFYVATTLYGGMMALAQGVFKDGIVTHIALVKGLPPPPQRPFTPNSTMEFIIGEVSSDGVTQILTHFQIKVGSNGQPSGIVGGTMSLATKNADGSFTKTSTSDDILKNINALGKILYGGNVTADGLELFFSNSDVPGTCGKNCRISLYVARRSSSSEPFGVPQEITTPWRTAEGPYPSPDGKYLYFHRILSSSDAKVYVMTREK